MMEALELLLNIWPALTAAASIAGALVMLFLSTRFVSRASFDAFSTENALRHQAAEKRQHDTDLALKDLAAQLARMPTAEHIEKLSSQSSETNARLARLEGQNEAMSRNLQLLLKAHTTGGGHA